MSRWTGTAAWMLLMGLSGCVSTPRVPSADSERDGDLRAVATVGDVTEVGNAGPLQVSGVGLVTGLDGTGGTPQGEWRTMLEKDLRQRRIDEIAKLIASPNNALVMVTAMIPAGARKGEPIDVQVSLPPGSPCTSLRGGYLQGCLLRSHATTKSINPDYDGGDRLLQGHTLAVAKGPLVVGFGEPEEAAELKRGRLWEGGVSLIERPYVFVLKKDDRSAQVANRVANRINLKFPDDPRKQESVQRHRNLYLLDGVTQQLNGAFEGAGSRGDVAKALNMELINVRVPYAYRYNPERYLRVARLIPLQEDAQAQAQYRNRLAQMLHDPQHTIRAALRLEALGRDSVGTLKQGLASEHDLVRFAAAEALVYLGETVGVEEVTAAAHRHPHLRAYALIALVGLDEGVCRSKLNELLNTDDFELRAGAFQALRLTLAESARSEAELEAAMARLGGERLGGFWLYRVAPNSARAVNFAVAKRPEIILFGSDVLLAAPVRVRAGEEFTVTLDEGEDRCFVSRVPVGGRTERRECSARLDEVLRALVDLGAQYTDVIDLLRQLERRQGVNCEIKHLTPPQALPLDELLAQMREPAAAP